MKLLNWNNILTYFKIQAKIRLVESLLSEKYPEQNMKCPMHLCLGQESVAAALGLFAEKTDIFLGNYRSHGHYLAKGGNLYTLFAEILGSKEGCSGGMGGSMHIMDLDTGFYGTSAIVGATIPIAAGIALGYQSQDMPKVTVVFFGDAAMEEGVIYETINFSKLHSLPILFVCENNDKAIETPLKERSATLRLFDRFLSFEVPSKYIDTQDIHQTLVRSEEAYQFVRKQAGPLFLEFKVERWSSHVGPAVLGPLNLWIENPWSAQADACVLAKTVRLLLENKQMTTGALKNFYKETKHEIERVFEKAFLEKQSPEEISARETVYASGLLSSLPDSVKKKKFKSTSLHINPDNSSKMVNPF